MKRVIVGIGYALVGLLLAAGLTAGAYAIGGRELSRPARQVRFPAEVVSKLAPSPTPTATGSPEDRASPDDKGSDAQPDAVEDKSGSSNSGSGSFNSGPGSSNSGSGSGDDEPETEEEPDDD